MRNKLYNILSVAEEDSLLSKLYNYLNIGMTTISLIPLMFNRQSESLLTIEIVAAIFFVVDYLLRWATADYALDKDSKLKAFIAYPISFYAIIDILAILPFLGLIDQSLRLFRLFRLFRSLRVFRAIHLFRNSTSFGVLSRAIKRQKDSLIIVAVVVSSYIFIAALLVFNLEPDTFPNFLDALVWATESLTTATYTDYYPTSGIGQTLSIISYLVGVGIIALPSSILTAGYLDELEEIKGAEPKQTENQDDEDHTEMEEVEENN